MTNSAQVLSQMNKASKLTNRTYHKNGPKSFKKGQGALIKVLHKKGGEATRNELIETLGFNRKELKNVARKAERNGYVTIENCEQCGYKLILQAEGDAIAEKRCKAHAKTADDILSCLTAEEVEQLYTLTEKVILSCKELGAHGKHKATCSCHDKKCAC